MRVYITNKCPIKSARCLDDKTLKGSIEDTAKLLLHVMAIDGYLSEDVNLADPVFIKHPLTEWALEKSGNINWLVNYFIALCNAHDERFGEIAQDAEFIAIFRLYMSTFDCPREQTPFVNLMTKTNHPDDVFIANQASLVGLWQDYEEKPTWTKAIRPLWSRTA